MPNLHDLNHLNFFSLLIFILIINFLFFKKIIFSIVDPIWFFVIVNTSVTLTLVIYDRFDNSDYISIYYLIACHVAFIASLIFSKKIIGTGFEYKTQSMPIREKNDGRIPVSILNISSFILLLVFIYHINMGLSLLSNDPELARVLARRDGGGAIHRLFSVFTYLSLTLWFYINLKKIKIGLISRYIGIILPIVLLLTTGSKASLLFVYISFFYVSYYISIENGMTFRFPIKYFVITTVLIIFISIYMLSARAEQVGAGDTALEFAGIELLQRIIFSGTGAFHYFSTDIPSLKNLNAIDYFRQYILQPTLAPFRILEYQPTVGNLLAISMVGDDTFGPNPSMYVEGKIYFGLIFGVFYCGVLGFVFSIFRYYFLTLTKLPSYVRVTLFSFGCMLINTMTYDMVLFVGEVFNTFIFLIPILFLSILLREMYK